MTYWLDLFTGITWNEFRSAGSNVTGFRDTRWKTVQRIKEGDVFLCYITGISRFVGLLEVTGKPFQDETPIWKDQVFPCRLPVKPLLELDPEYGVSVHDLRDRLSCFLNSESRNAWTGAFRGSPTKWSQADGDAVSEALRHAEQHPNKLPTDPKKLARKPRSFVGKDKKAVTIPEDDDVPVLGSPRQRCRKRLQPSTQKYKRYSLDSELIWASMYGSHGTTGDALTEENAWGSFPESKMLFPCNSMTLQTERSN